MPAPSPSADPSLADRLRAEVDRAYQRSLKGLEFIGSPAPPVGRTPKTLLHRRGTLSLYHYHATASEVYRVPILFVMATTNKAYIFDLAPG
ncbi:MAG: poly-beta-hydroxybutyrate polymerase, partial [Variovorax sp.]